ncbi:MAG TPA: dephospho-CoA kinase [Phaeodactylibacter sp.]|nr:dephospho-CoA kinase [Phaeodactylibacter sp.]
MLKVGITGGIGSGKTTACKKFAILGIPTYYADERAKQLMVENKTLVRQIKKLFGNSAYTPSGELNRPHIAAIAFADKAKLALLNALVHPAVQKDSMHWFRSLKACPFALYEAALLFEAGNDKNMDYIITITAPLELRIQRVMHRDSIPREAVLARIQHQMNEAEKVKRADFVIYNDHTHKLTPQVVHIFHLLTVV